MIDYSNRIAQTGPLSLQITEALDALRKQRVFRELDDKWEAGEYHNAVITDEKWLSAHPVPPIPDNLKEDSRSTDVRSVFLQRGRFGTAPSAANLRASGLSGAGLGGSDPLFNPRREYLINTSKSLEL